ncbi:MAG: UDP-3-O-acyl-N-acetylglucosamine deacetylase [Armatimonadota bacterium]|nr:UDP-3-O-acyl-N-acetylglucosamine deacetylase [Armatimonadota bacterium]
MRQSTLKTSAEIEGIGLHTGEKCKLTLLPAPENTGIVFVTPAGEIKAVVENVEATNRGVVLKQGTARVHTVEHLLSALAGMGVDNAILQVNGPEIPSADGSALPFVELIECAGVESLSAEVEPIYVAEPVWVGAEDKRAIALQNDNYRVTGIISFSHPMIGEQMIDMQVEPEIFKREIAPARTFCTEEEIEAILSSGLGRGGTSANVVIVRNGGYSTSLRFQDEFVRHKVLDLIGDLSLVGGRLAAHVITIKAGHALHAALAGRIKQSWARRRQGG